MNDISTLVSTAPETMRQDARGRPAVRSGRRCGLRSLMAAWQARRLFRKQLEEMVKANPHMIDDIGLNRRQAEAEIAKSFWQP